MRTSLNEIRHIEQFLAGALSPGDSLAFQARVIVEPALRTNVSLQSVIYCLAKEWHRRKIKKELSRLHRDLFLHEPDFKHSVLKKFNDFQ